MKRLITFLVIILFAFFTYAQHYKKDGTLDMRYKENRSTYTPSPTPTYTPSSTPTYNPSNNSTHLKKDGTPDKRYKENNSNYSTPNYSTNNTSYNSGTRLKKDGTPDLRYRENNPKYNLPLQRDKNGKIIRSEAAIYEFKVKSGYPNGRQGYVIDHIVPLKKGGCDCPENMQWQTIEEAKAKDKWE
jgi:hypothetical protein